MFVKKIFFLFMFLITAGLFAQEIQTAILIGGPGGFRVGGYYNILQYRANVREKPSRDGDIIAVLSLNDRIEILDYSDIEEVINGTHGFWIKIKRGNIVGYTFSGNIAMRSLITKLAITDNNDEITDEVAASFHFRRSRPSYSNDGTFRGWYFNAYDNFDNELFLYINNQRINTDRINIIPGPLDHIEFEGGRDSVLIYFLSYAREGDRKYIYKIRNNGIIEFIGEYGDWYPDWYIGKD